ncbi:MAG: 2-oxo acid dehydrogenase subunit E2, partial [Cytophagaceae bacterium]
MAIEMKVPAVGESITEVTIAKWNKKEGDFVNIDEVLCELESDKATFELNATSAGVLHIKAKEGDTLQIGGLVCEIEANGASKTPAKKEEPKKEAEPAKKSSGKSEVIEMKVPAVGESIAEVTIAKWMKKDGDTVKAEDVLCEIESEKATFELTAEASGTLQILAKEGQTLAIGAPICKIAVSGDLPVKTEEKKTPVTTEQSGDKNYASGHESPAANKILAEKGITAQEIKGTGKDGRITKEDAVNAQKKEAVSTAKSGSENKVMMNGSRDQNRQKMTSLRKTVSRRLVAVKNETAMLTTFNEVDMKPIMDLRAKYKDQFKEKFQVGLGFMSFFTRACCTALQEYPAVNGMIDGDEIVYNNFCDISIAVSAPKGLVVPVIRNAEGMSFDQIEKEIVRLATRAKENKLSI